MSTPGGQGQPAVPLRDWINPATGDRIVRLPEEAGTQSLYFHQNANTAAGDKMVIEVPDGRWLVFRSNMHGAPHVYAVEVAGPPRS